MRTHKPLLTLCVSLMLFVNQGCYTYKMYPTGITPASTEYSETYWVFLWGALHANKQKLSPDCHKRGLSTATISSPAHYSLLTFFTLGLVKPVKIKWTCYQCVQAE